MKKSLLGHMPTDKEVMYRSIMENGIVGRELFNFVCGDLIGYGVSRAVCVYRPNPKLVIKVELDNYNANVLEYNIWRDVEHTALAKWFAPCVELSPCGRILLQKRCKGLEMPDYPDRVPVFFQDMKYANYGEYKGQFVCLDYAGSLLTSTGMTSRMKRAKWWQHNADGSYE